MKRSTLPRPFSILGGLNKIFKAPSGRLGYPSLADEELDITRRNLSFLDDKGSGYDTNHVDQGKDGAAVVQEIKTIVTASSCELIVSDRQEKYEKRFFGWGGSR